VAAGRQPLVRAALAGARAPRALERVSRPALAGLWLGLLSDEGLRALDERYYDGEEAYRTAAWNERGLFDWERAAVDRHFRGCERIAVAACGGGREVLALLEDGLDAVGYEPHPGLAAFAADLLAAHGHPGRVRTAPRDELPPDMEPCDGLVVGWGAYSLVHGRAARERLLAGARERLPAGAPVLLSFFETARHGRGYRATRAIAAALRRPRGRAPVELGDTLAPNLVHVFTRAELAGEVAAGGLDVVEHRLVGSAGESVSYAAAVARVP
jgi:hypothetical protein